MKPKRWKWYHFAGLFGIACLALVGALYLWVSQYDSVTVQIGSADPCFVTETQVSVYEIISPYDIVEQTCNTADYQEATTTLDDGTTLTYFIEFDGTFASWSAPENFACGSNWSDTNIETSGTAQLSDTERTIVACSDGVTEIVMVAYP